MKKFKMVLMLALISAFVLSGCSSSDNSSEIKAGVNEMLEVTAELQEAIEAGNEAKVKELGPELEEVWEKFEDGVKEKYPEFYEKVEDALDPTIAGSEASPLDQETVSKFNEQLSQALKELAEKVK